MEGLEEEEMQKGKLKLPGDLDDDDEDYGSDDEKGLSDYGGEDAELDFAQYGHEEDEEPIDEGEEEMEEVFARADEN